MRKGLSVLLAVLMLISCAAGIAESALVAKETEAGNTVIDAQLANTTITVMGINQPQFKKNGCTNLFWAKYYNGTIKQMVVPAADVYNALATEIAADNAPDLVMSHGGFPSLVLTDAIQPVDDILTEEVRALPLFAQHATVYEAYEYMGKHYYLPWVTDQMTYIFYNTKIFEDNEMETPRDLYLRGEWDWNAFRDMAIELTVNEDNAAEAERWGAVLCTWHDSRFIYTTGESLFRNDGGRIVSNLDSPNIERAYNFLVDLVRVDKAASPNPDISYVIEKFTTGKAAMLLGPDFWSGDDTLTALREGKRIGWVPLPRDPQADKYYTVAEMIGYYMPQGAKNPEAIAPFIIAAMASMDEEGKEGTEAFENVKADYLEKWGPYGYTLEDMEAASEFNETFDQLNLVGDPYRDLYDPSTFFMEMMGMGADGVKKTYQQTKALVEPLMNLKIEEMGVN